MFQKIQKICSPFRIVLGAAAVIYAIAASEPIFFLGILPIIAGITKFCPICQFTSKCEIPVK